MENRVKSSKFFPPVVKPPNWLRAGRVVPGSGVRLDKSTIPPFDPKFVDATNLPFPLCDQEVSDTLTLARTDRSKQPAKTVFTRCKPSVFRLLRPPWPRQTGRVETQSKEKEFIMHTNMDFSGKGFIGSTKTETTNGTTIGTIRMAKTDNWKNDDGEKQSRSHWFSITSFNPSINDMIEKGWLTKGRYVEVIGELRDNRWTDKDNKEQFSVQLVADRINFLDRKPE